MLKRLSKVLLFISLSLSIGSVQADRLEQAALGQTRVDKVVLIDIAVAGERLVAVGEQGIIIFSDDAGKKWHQADVPISVMLAGLHFFDNQIGWAVGHDGAILKSKDGGESWEVLVNGHDLNQLRVSALELLLGNLSSQQTDDISQREEIEFQLEDAQIALEEQPSSPLLDILFVDSQTGFAVGAYGLLFKTEDGGVTWRYIGHSIPNPEGLHLNALYLTDNGELFILGEAGLLLHSSDQGNTWDSVSVPYQGSFFSMVENEGLYLMGLRGSAFKREGANNWVSVELPVQATINGAVVVNEQVYLVGQGGALLQQDGDRFKPYGKRGLLSFSAISQSDNYLIIVGEGGVTRVSLEGSVNE